MLELLERLQTLYFTQFFVVNFSNLASVSMESPKQEPHSNGHVPVPTIGASVSGISIGYHLKAKLDFEYFRIVDRLSGVGG